MTSEEDIDRVFLRCRACEDVVVGRRWPSGTVRVMGQDGCDCGSTDLVVVEDVDTDGESDGADRNE